MRIKFFRAPYRRGCHSRAAQLGLCHTLFSLAKDVYFLSDGLVALLISIYPLGEEFVVRFFFLFFSDLKSRYEIALILYTTVTYRVHH